MSTPHRRTATAQRRAIPCQQMTSWWEVVILVVAMIGSGLIGGIIGVRLARRDETRRYEDGWLPSISDARFVERRASVYFEVAVGWHAYLDSVRPLAYPSEGSPSQRPRDLAAVIRSRAELEQFGTIAAQRLHDEALDGAVTLINILRALPKLRGTGAPDLVLGRQPLRALLVQLGAKIDELELQMGRDLQSAQLPADLHVELTGRPKAVDAPAAAHRTPAKSG